MLGIKRMSPLENLMNSFKHGHITSYSSFKSIKANYRFKTHNRLLFNSLFIVYAEYK